MRDFGQPVGPEVRAEIMALAQAIFNLAEPKREVRASEFAMEEHPDRVVVDEVDLKHEGERLRIAITKPEARPPFEWLLEITSDVGESLDYFKHYLIRDDDVVLAQRKVLTPIDASEAELVMRDLRTAQSWLEE
jgi:hypothetical protein